MKYAIIDLETTGGKPADEAITEIAIYIFDGNEIIDHFSSLVNPERPIHWYVQKLTGINNKMLRRAPKFYEIAKRVVEMTEDTIIVAHNAAFDYRVLKKEFDRLGYPFERPSLCTVKLSKEIFPNKESYSLGKLCKELHIPITDRHRATGDALATVELFKMILNKQRNLLDRIEMPGIKPVKKIRKDIVQTINDLPPKKGVVYFYNKYDQLIGIQAARNIKKKVNNIYIKDNPKALDLQRQINTIDYEIIQGNLISKVIAWHYRFKENPVFTPCTKRRLNFEDHQFSNNSMILVDKGHHTGEKSLIYIENQKVIGYGFFELEWQNEAIDVIKNRLTPIDDHPSIRKIIQDYLDKYRLEKIIRIDQ
ncbi:MAG TPA: DNA polymerase III subunit epsilon [Flavobacteriales bacterium]|nr:DNA polymerase III subunit epsilon [Flavobacteriales bacterium]